MIARSVPSSDIVKASVNAVGHHFLFLRENVPADLDKLKAMLGVVKNHDLGCGFAIFFAEFYKHTKDYVRLNHHEEKSFIRDIPKGVLKKVILDAAGSIFSFIEAPVDDRWSCFLAVDSLFLLHKVWSVSFNNYNAGDIKEIFTACDLPAFEDKQKFNSLMGALCDTRNDLRHESLDEIDALREKISAIKDQYSVVDMAVMKVI
jgi:hypothetical protein